MGSARDEALAYVRRVAAAYDPHLRLAETETVNKPAAAVGGVLVCAPHPDDESLCGALPLRLAREDGCPVTALAVTLGSDAARKEARLREFADACGVLGWGWQLARQPLAMDGISPAQRDRDPAAWEGKVAAVVAILAALRPALVLLPHLDDAHPTHVGTHQLCMEALVRHATDCGGEILIAETEFWRPLGDANLLVGVGEEDVARLVLAVSRHRGEIVRHPYHAQLPFRMVETVRRGAEMLAGFGGGVPPFRFGELYRLARLMNGRLLPATRGVILDPAERLSLAALRSAC
ncbi:MAG: PIG-L family deacetylase [Desulfobulbaceae bacterium]|nr:PIG-L family deacetylase [Desulfobulbaceae bacterium]